MGQRIDSRITLGQNKDMTNTTITSINFRTDKNCKRIAYRFDRQQHRSFRMPLEQALLMVSAGVARIDQGMN